MSGSIPLLAMMTASMWLALPDPASSLDVEMRVVFANDVFGNNPEKVRAAMGRIKPELARFLANHPTARCNDIKVSVGRIMLDPNLNPDNVAIASKVTLDTFRKRAEELDGNVLVVRALSYCNGNSSSFAGCAGPGSSLVVEYDPAWTGLIHASLWLHEFGHSQGLESAISPEKAHSASAADLMYPSVTGVNTKLSEAECNFMRSATARFRPASSGAVVAPAAAVVEIAAGSDAGTAESSDSADFAVEVVQDTPFAIVTSPWIGGVPYEILDAIENRAGLLDFARGLIVKLDTVDHWANASKVLAYYGARNDSNLLFWLLSYPEDNLAEQQRTPFNKGKIAAIESVGILAGRYDDRQALRRLEEIKTRLTLVALANEGTATGEITEAIDQPSAAAVVLDTSSPYVVGDALGATIVALAAAQAAIEPDVASADAAAYVQVQELADGSISVPLGEEQSVIPAQVDGAVIPLTDGQIALPKNVDPNLVGSLSQLIDSVKNAESFDAFIRQ